MPDEAKKVAIQELERLQQMPPAAAEYAVTRHYLDWIIALPWTKETEDKLDLKEAERILERATFWADKSQRPAAGISRRHQTPQTESKGRSFAWSGPPGVGKTSLGKSVADALGRKFARIALGGMRDEAEIRGHRRTYVGALPGRIIQTLRRVESRNPVILLDELDKVGADFRGDPRRRCSKCSTRRRTTLSPIIISICRSTFRGCCSSPPQLAGPDSSGIARSAGSHRTAQLHRIRKTADCQTLSGPAPIGRTRADKQEVKIPGHDLAPGDPRLHARSRRAPVGTRDRRAHAQSHAQDRQQRRVNASRSCSSPNRLNDYLGRSAVRFRDRGDDQGNRHCHRPGLDACGRRNPVHRSHAHAGQRTVCCSPARSAM